MFEFSVAFKYLLPRWRQLSASIISLISILVIALVVWLVVLFFSVTQGLEKIWVNKLIALTAPVRMTPTEDYYRSYYYLVDGVSSNSNYTLKSLHEKLLAPLTDPYDPDIDEELPYTIPPADRHEDGSVKNLTQLAHQAVNDLKQIDELAIKDYEMTFTNLKLRLLREIGHPIKESQSFLSQGAYLGSFDPVIEQTVLPISAEDIQNTFEMLFTHEKNVLAQFFQYVNITQLKAGDQGWKVPIKFFPAPCQLEGCAIEKKNGIDQIFLPIEKSGLPSLERNLKENGAQVKRVIVKVDANHHFTVDEKNVGPLTSFLLPAQTPLSVRVNLSSLNNAKTAQDVLFETQIALQGIVLQGKLPFHSLKISAFTLKDGNSPFWISNGKLPSDPLKGDGILAPKSFKEAGAFIGDRGHLSYYTPTTSSIQEMQLPIFIAGFYDPGIIPIGGKYLLANSELTSQIRSSHNQEDTALSNGFNIRFENVQDAPKVKAAIKQALKEKNIDRYWKVETYREYEFTKDLIQQLGSEKNIFTLISTIIIIVACSNIVSMLIILVNDKKSEIGILRSMGASSFSIGAIFGCCGMIMGMLGSILGAIAAIITLKNLDSLIAVISQFQGHEVFNPLYYGKSLPHEVSFEALLFVVAATAIISLLSGIIPAVKACTVNPSKILRSE